MLNKPVAMRDQLLGRILEGMAENKKTFFVSADFGSPVLDQIRSHYPGRFVNVGIAEQNLINVSAGLALEGFQVFAYAIAPFITMRCFEQSRVNLGLLSEVRSMNVNLIGVGAGFSYVMSGPTHQCYEDITIMRSIPNFQIFSPADHHTAGGLYERCIERKGPKYLRLDAQVLQSIYNDETRLSDKGFGVHGSGKGAIIVSTGYMVHGALKAQTLVERDSLGVTVVDLFDLTGFDREALASLLKEHSVLISLEEGFRGRGGLDALLYEILSEYNIPMRYLNLGIDNKYRFELGSRQELHETIGLDPVSIGETIIKFASGHRFSSGHRVDSSQSKLGLFERKTV